jgi:hypothetical protein
MGRRQQQHQGRTAGDDTVIPGRDVEGVEDVEVAGDATRAVEMARDVTRLIDREEGYDARKLREERDGPPPRRKRTKGNQGQG